MATDDPKPIYPTKARYRLLETSYLNGEVVVVEQGDGAKEVFVEYDGHPGSNLAPASPEAEKRKAHYMAMRRQTDEQIRTNKMRLIGGAFDGGLLAIPGGLSPPPVPMPTNAQAEVEIPDDWRTWNAGRRVLLAAKLGAPETCDTAQLANDFIEAELTRRAQSKAA